MSPWTPGNSAFELLFHSHLRIHWIQIGSAKISNYFLFWLLWNLSLAAIPVALGHLAAGLGHRMRRRPAPWLWLGLAPLLLLWLMFLPNSCYLLTEPRHLLLRIAHWTQAREEPRPLLRLAVWTAVALVDTVAGALTFVLSVRPVKRLAETMGLDGGRWAAPFFILISLGVYLGLVGRFNTWDLFTRPAAVIDSLGGLASRPLLVTAIVLVGLMLWRVYGAVEACLDRIAVPWRRRRRNAPCPAGRSGHRPPSVRWRPGA
jgi:uncharacterized membrane protein